MATRQHRPSRLRRLVLPLTTGLVLLYFGYHATIGENGLARCAELTERTLALEAQLAAIQAANARLDRQIALLDPAALDRDYVDELIRAQIGLVNPRDVVIPSASAVSGR